MKNAIDIEGLMQEVGKCCLGENCNSCRKEQCLVGYSKKSLLTILKQQNEFIDGGMLGIPGSDTKLYDDESIIETMAFLLHQCRNCNLYHDEECIINIIRSSLEIILFGEYQEYKGSTLLYFGDIKMSNAEVAEKLLKAFQNRKN